MLLLALGMNGLICMLSCGIVTGGWNRLPGISGGAVLELSYQHFFVFSMLLMLQYAGAVLTGRLLRKFWKLRWTAGRSGKLAGLIISGCWFLLAGIFLFIGIQGQNHILISEFYLPDKKTTLEPRESYIEIANNGRFSYEVTDLYLSDDRNHLQKLQVSPDKLSPGETILIPMDGNVFDFGRKGGDLLLLSNQNGEILDELITGDTRKNKSYTRNYADRTWEYRDPSPGVYNLEKPVFSAAPGFYEESFYLKLSAQGDADIYYTWDGSIPTLQSEKYTGKILIYDRSEEQNQYRSIQNVTRNWLEKEVDPTPVPKATVIRAIAVNADGFASEIATGTYFVNQTDAKDHYVVSLVAEPEDLFGPQGIYSTGEAYDQWYLNGKNGEEPKPNFEIRGLECAGNFELFHATPLGYLNQACGIRIQGGSHRTGALKRMSVFSREEYSGSEFFDQNLFGNRKSHSAALRSGFENAFTMELVPGRSLETQKSIPVMVFLNGEYWYKTYLQEKYSDEYFEEKHQLEDVEFLKSGITGEMKTFVQENDMQTEDAYRRFGEMVDIQSYIDYMCANIYLANTDYAEWQNGGNSAIWQSRKVEDSSYGDGRWRWALYDMDLITSYSRNEQGLNDITDAEVNSFTFMRKWAGPVEDRLVYSSLKQNPQFRKQFVLTFMDMANTCFAPDFVEGVLADWGEDLSYHDSFFLNRKGYITGYLAEVYELAGTQETLSLEISDPAAGRVRVNTCEPDLSDGHWDGTYFTDYPVTLAAEAYGGYRFVRWEGDIQTEDPVITLNLPEGGMSVRAVYESYQK